MKRKFYLLIVFVVIVAVLVYVLNRNNPEKIVYAISVEPENLNPFLPQYVDFPLIFSQIFEPLFTFDYETSAVKPNLADSWELSSDKKAYTIYLKKGILFHNGEELTSRDVYDTFSPYFLNNHNFKNLEPSILSEILQRIEIQGKYKLVFYLKRVYSPFLKILSSPFISCIISGRVMHSFLNGGEFKPIGTGPFLVKDWIKGKSILLEKNKRYWGKIPRINCLEFKICRHWKRHDLMVEGKIDVTSPVAGNYFRVFEENNISIFKNIPISLVCICFNNRKNPFKNIYLRKAALKAINRKEIVYYINQGNAIPADSPLPPGILGHSKELKQEKYDPPVARRYIKLSGVKGKIKATFAFYSEFAFRSKGMINTIIRQLNKSGFDVDLITFDSWNEYDRYIKNGKADIFLDGIKNSILDPDGTLYPLFYSKFPENIMNYNNPEVDRLLIKGITTFDQKEREKIYIKIQGLLIKDTPCIFFNFYSPYFGVSPRIKNFRLSPLSLPDFKEVIIE